MPSDNKVVGEEENTPGTRRGLRGLVCSHKHNLTSLPLTINCFVVEDRLCATPLILASYIATLSVSTPHGKCCKRCFLFLNL